MIRHYVVPIVGNGQTAETAFRPKYFSPGAGEEAELFPRGLSVNRCLPGRTVCLVRADVTADQHTALVAESDVTWIDVRLNQLTTPERRRLRAVLSGDGTALPSDARTAATVLEDAIQAAQDAHG